MGAQQYFLQLLINTQRNCDKLLIKRKMNNDDPSELGGLKPDFLPRNWNKVA